MLTHEILEGETYRGWNGGERRVEWSDGQVVTYTITKRAATPFSRVVADDTKTMSLKAFAAWAKERVK